MIEPLKLNMKYVCSDLTFFLKKIHINYCIEPWVRKLNYLVERSVGIVGVGRYNFNLYWLQLKRPILGTTLYRPMLCRYKVLYTDSYGVGTEGLWYSEPDTKSHPTVSVLRDCGVDLDLAI